jgi:diguanylate cyclase (GGDEF)-like protein
MALIDSLTGAFNRRYMETALQKEINRSSRYKKVFSVIILDLDNFKRINDTHGHLFGDEVLCRFAEFIKSQIRLEDVFCRYGGEEFLILLPETSAEQAKYFIDRIIRCIHDHEFFRTYDIHFSGGIATYPESGGTISDLLAQADRALYQAKFGGKDRVLLSSPDRRKYIRHPHQWEVWLSYKKDLGSEEEHAFTENISIGGIRVLSENIIPLETSIMIKIRKSTSKKDPLALQGTLVWGRKLEEHEYAYGVAFKQIGSTTIKKLSIDLPKNQFYSEIL